VKIYDFLNDARVGCENDEESPEVEKMGNEEDVEREEIMFGGKPRKMKDIVKQQYSRCRKEGEKDLFFISTG
jgi:hypothetical protein